MNVEPAVEKSIRRNRLVMKRGKVGIYALLTFCVLACAALVVWNHVDTGLKMTGEHSGLELFFVLIFTLATCVNAYFINRSLLKVWNQFTAVTAEVREYDVERFKLFKDSLDAVSLGLGLQPPALTVVNMKTANSLSFTKGGRKFVGVSPSLLSADLTQAEVEAVMAHEIAHTASGESLKRPPLLGLFLFFVLLYPLTVVLGAAVSDGLSLPLIAVTPIVSFFGFVFTGIALVIKYGAGNPEMPRFPQDILADSVAVKITSDPGSLKSALHKLCGLMVNSRDMPSERLTFSRLFVGPLKHWSIREQMETFDYAPDYETTVEHNFMKDMKEFIRRENDLLDERFENVSLIEQNSWQAFDQDWRRFTKSV